MQRRNVIASVLCTLFIPAALFAQDGLELEATGSLESVLSVEEISFEELEPNEDGIVLRGSVVAVRAGVSPELAPGSVDPILNILGMRVGGDYETTFILEFDSAERLEKEARFGGIVKDASSSSVIALGPFLEKLEARLTLDCSDPGAGVPFQLQISAVEQTGEITITGNRYYSELCGESRS